MESNEKIEEYTTGRPCIDAPHIPWHAARVSTALQCYAGLDFEALQRFVTSPTLFGADRRVLSWVDSYGSGYPYDEVYRALRPFIWMARESA